MPFYCDLEKSKIKTNVRIVNLANKFIFKLLLVLFYLVGLAALGFVIISFTNLFYLTEFEYFFFSLIALSFLFFVSCHIYYKGSIKKPKLSLALFELEEKKTEQSNERINLADYFSLQAFSVFWKAVKESKEAQVENRILLKLLIEEKKVEFIFKRAGIDIKKFLAKLEKFPKEEEKNISKEEIATKALNIALMETHERIELGDLLAVLAFTDPFLGNELFNLNLEPEDFLNIIYWETVEWREKEERKFNPERPKLTGGIGKDWASGYTQILSRFARDLTVEATKNERYLDFLAHQEEIASLEKILVRATHHNTLLIGEPGVGKKTIVLGLAQRIAKGMTYRGLSFRHLMELDINFLLAGAKSPGEIVDRLAGVLNDAVMAGNIILFIDGIDALFGGGEGEVGAVDASQVILPYLEAQGLFFIATSTTSDYHQHIEVNKAVADKFEKIEVKEPKKSQVVRILEDITPEVERQAPVIFTYQSLKSIVELSDRYIYQKPFPEKAIDLLNEVAVYAASEGKGTMVTSRHVESVISKKTNIPVGEAAASEKERLLNLEKILHQKVVGQDEAIKVISNAMRRARAGMGSSKKPIGTFMFLGPTGVGKTETCKALASAYFGSEEAMIRFDMSEYQDISGIHQLIGAPQGSPEAQAGGKLTNAVRDNPFSLILFDEIEKAHPDILNLFLQVFDEGWITDSLGRKVKFNNTIIIATSNAGAQLIQEGIKQGLPQEDLKERLWNYLQEKGIFRPEFLNRFTAVVNFNPLTQEQVITITGMLMDKLAEGLEKEKGIYIQANEAAIVKLAQLGYDPLMGARPIQRIIQKKVEDLLAQKMLSGEIKRGDTLDIGAEDISDE